MKKILLISVILLHFSKSIIGQTDLKNYPYNDNPILLRSFSIPNDREFTATTDDTDKLTWEIPFENSSQITIDETKFKRLNENNVTITATFHCKLRFESPMINQELEIAVRMCDFGLGGLNIFSTQLPEGTNVKDDPDGKTVDVLIILKLKNPQAILNAKSIGCKLKIVLKNPKVGINSKIKVLAGLPIIGTSLAPYGFVGWQGLLFNAI